LIFEDLTPLSLKAEGNGKQEKFDVAKSTARSKRGMLRKHPRQVDIFAVLVKAYAARDYVCYTKRLGGGDSCMGPGDKERPIGQA